MKNILIPATGDEKRFIEAGYELPKPFIDINGKPLIQRVVESLYLDGQYIFILQKEHLDKYDGYNLLKQIVPGCIIIPVGGITEGAVSACLLAEKYINNNDELIIANSDQVINYNVADFLIKINYCDGCILTSSVNNNPKRLYVETNRTKVSKILDKIPISNKSDVGLYGWCRGKDFISSAKQMIGKNIRTNGEFYIAQTYNELIENGYWITWQDVTEFLPCGSPEDLNFTLPKLIYKSEKYQYIANILCDITEYEPVKNKYKHAYLD